MHTETRRVGYFERIKEALAGVVIGVVLFFASFVVLYINEGAQKLSEVIEDATAIEDSETSAEGIITYTGVVTSNSPVGGDGEFISGGQFLSISRTVDIYSWTEIKETSTQRNVGGSETQTTEYSYRKKWNTDSPESESFKEPQGHGNVGKTIINSNANASNIKIGSYELSSTPLPEIHYSRDISFNEVNVLKGTVTGDNFIFISRGGSSSYANPEIGDQRIGYSVVGLDIEMTFVGGLRDGKLREYVKDANAFELFAGDRDSALNKASKEDRFRIWIFRLIGFAMMGIGIFLILNPLSVLLDVLPIFGNVSRTGVFLLAFIVSFVLSIMTIIISILAHNIIALAIVILLSIIATFFFLKKKGKN